MFIFEIIAASFCKDDYLVVPEQKLLKNETIFESFVRRAKFGSFYFWSDMLATISLIFEIPWTGASLGGDELNRAGDTANTGARASKTIRLVRMVRLIRLVKLYKYTSKIREKEEELSPPQCIPKIVQWSSFCVAGSWTSNLSLCVHLLEISVAESFHQLNIKRAVQ